MVTQNIYPEKQRPRQQDFLSQWAKLSEEQRQVTPALFDLTYLR